MALNSTAQQLAQYLETKLGFTQAGAAGWLGNTQVESDFNTSAYNSSEHATGLQQWEGGRGDALAALAKSMGQPITSLAVQEQQITNELSGPYSSTLTYLQHATDPGAAAAYVDQNYEHSSGAARATRVSDAQSIYSQLTSGGAPVTAPSAGVAPTAKNYFDKFLQAMGVPQSAWAGDEVALASVENYEGNNNRYNPFNVIQAEAGSTSFNSVGVQAYASFDTGVQGSAALFSGSHWSQLQSALKTGNSQSVIQAFDAGYTWSPGTNIPLLSGTNLANELARDVGPNPGTGSTTGGTTDAINIPNPGNIPGDIAGGVAGASAGAIEGAIEDVIEKFVGPLVHFLEDSLLVVFGIIIVIVGLVLLAKAAGNGKSGSPGAAAAPASSGGGKTEEAEPEAEEAAAAA